MDGSPGSLDVSTKLERIAKLAEQIRGAPLMTLAHHMDVEWLREAYRRTRKDGATGVDGQSARQYAEHLEGNLQGLRERAMSGAYRAPPVRRAYIPKEGGKRPLGIPTFEDKVLQRAVGMLLEPVYEQEFLDCSYGFRPGRSAHDALRALRNAMMEMGGGWLLEVDIEKFFDSIQHAMLRAAYRRRVGDKVIDRLLGKWLNAGVLEDGRLSRPDEGTPQGGPISPLLANIFLHEVLDVWFTEEVRPRLKGRAVLVRYADDFVIAFEREDDARRVHDVMPKRFGKYGLKLHPEKTRLVEFRPPPRGGKSASFDLLGFTHRWEKSQRGHWVIMLVTAKKRFGRALERVSEWVRDHRHDAVKLQWKVLCQKLAGFYGYYGIVGNLSALLRFRRGMYRAWRAWLNRRSQRARVTWEKMRLLHGQYPLPAPAALKNLRP